MTLAEVEAHNKRVAEGKKKAPLDTAGMISRVPKVEHGLTPDQLIKLFKKKRGGMNQTESRFKKILEERYPKALILYEHIKLKLGPECWYCPDFVVFQFKCPVMFFEVKGKFKFEDSIIKLKTAAHTYPNFRFCLSQWKDGQWKEKPILPE